MTEKQIDFLRALSTAEGPLPRKRLALLAGAHPTTTFANAIGTTGPERWRRQAWAGYPSLIALGYVKTRLLDIDGARERCYEISAKGRRALSAIEGEKGEQ